MALAVAVTTQVPVWVGAPTQSGISDMSLGRPDQVRRAPDLALGCGEQQRLDVRLRCSHDLVGSELIPARGRPDLLVVQPRAHGRSSTTEPG
jgi:hypothetical protein